MRTMKRILFVLQRWLGFLDSLERRTSLRPRPGAPITK
jgi:hypothetical protein